MKKITATNFDSTSAVLELCDQRSGLGKGLKDAVSNKKDAQRELLKTEEKHLEFKDFDTAQAKIDYLNKVFYRYTLTLILIL